MCPCQVPLQSAAVPTPTPCSVLASTKHNLSFVHCPLARHLHAGSTPDAVSTIHSMPLTARHALHQYTRTRFRYHMHAYIYQASGARQCSLCTSNLDQHRLSVPCHTQGHRASLPLPAAARTSPPATYCMYELHINCHGIAGLDTLATALHKNKNVAHCVKGEHQE